MDDLDTIAEQAKDEIHGAKRRCIDAECDHASRVELWAVIRRKEPDTRWAVFAAYKNFPWRLRDHARKYSNGSVSETDCDHWLESQGLGHSTKG